MREGQERVSSGCAISGMLSKNRIRMIGDSIIKSISVVHGRSSKHQVGGIKKKGLLIHGFYVLEPDIENPYKHSSILFWLRYP